MYLTNYVIVNVNLPTSSSSSMSTEEESLTEDKTDDDTLTNENDESEPSFVEPMNISTDIVMIYSNLPAIELYILAVYKHYLANKTVNISTLSLTKR